LASKIDNDISQLHQDREEFEEDLRLVTLPFGINLMARNSQYVRYDTKVGSNSMNMGMGILNESMASNRSGVNANSDELSYILWFSIVFGLCEIVVIYIKYDFVNVLTLLLSSSWSLVCSRFTSSTISITSTSS